jgi:hypothetical protein
MEQFFDEESLENPLQQIAKHSLSKEFIKEVWSGHGGKRETSRGKLGKFPSIAERGRHF